MKNCKKAIQTSMLDTWVIIGPATGTARGPDPTIEGRDGVITNVYLDPDGDPKYTVLIPETGKYYDFYSCHFIRDPQQPRFA